MEEAARTEHLTTSRQGTGPGGDPATALLLSGRGPHSLRFTRGAGMTPPRRAQRTAHQRGPVAAYPAGPRAPRVPAVLPDRHTAPSMAPLASLAPPPTAPTLERVPASPMAGRPPTSSTRARAERSRHGRRRQVGIRRLAARATPDGRPRASHRLDCAAHRAGRRDRRQPAVPPPHATRVVLVATVHAAGTSAVGQV